MWKLGNLTVVLKFQLSYLQEKKNEKTGSKLAKGEKTMIKASKKQAKGPPYVHQYIGSNS